jgi:hypothetical protein
MVVPAGVVETPPGLPRVYGHRRQAEDPSTRNAGALMGLPAIGDSPDSAGVASTLAGMGSEIGWIQVSQPNSVADQRFAPRPPALVNKPG